MTIDQPPVASPKESFIPNDAASGQPQDKLQPYRVQPVGAAAGGMRPVTDADGLIVFPPLGSAQEKDLGKSLAAEAVKEAHTLETIGNSARGVRETLERFGIKLDPMNSAKQGEALEKSGLFDRVDAKDVQAGDVGYRHWSAETIERKGLGDVGDSFIVSAADKDGVSTANDHISHVSDDKGYYAPGITYLRPNAKFEQANESYKATGKMTEL